MLLARFHRFLRSFFIRESSRLLFPPRFFRGGRHLSYLIPVLLLCPTFTLASERLSPAVVELDAFPQASSPPYFLSPSLHHLIDPGGMLEIDDLRGNIDDYDWRSQADDYGTVGRVAQPLWFYVALNSVDVAMSGSFIQVRHNLLEEVLVYVFVDGRLAVSDRFDNRRGFSDRAFSQPSLIVPIDIVPGKQYQFFFRVDSRTVIDFPLFLHSSASGMEAVGAQGFSGGLYYGMVIVMVLYNLFIFLSTRDFSYLNYVGFISCIGLMLSAIGGAGYQYLWPDYPQLNQYSVELFASLAAFFAVLFTASFLELWHRGGWLRNYYLLLLVASLFSVFYSVWGAGSALDVVSLLSMWVYPSFLLSALYCWWRGQTFAHYFIIAWGALCVLVAVISTAAIGWFGISVDKLWPMVRFGSAAEMVLLSLALAAKINALKVSEQQALRQSEAKSDFIAQVSHELRTPMNGVLGMSQLLDDRLEDETCRHYNKVIHQSGLALLGVINDVLDAAKIDAEKMQIERIAFDVHALARDSLYVIESQAIEKSIALRCDIAADVHRWALGDPHRIKQVLHNFLSNAIKFTEQGDIRLSLTLGDEPDKIYCSVADTGPGMSAETLAQLFIPYSQAASSTTRRYGGTGLGLYICKRLSQMMAGDIVVTSESPGGSVFTLQLPLPACAAPAQELAREAKSSVSPPLNILVAEDNLVNQAVIKGMLEKLGHRVELVENGLEAVIKVKQQCFNLLLMDCDMPEMDGYSASQAIIDYEQHEGVWPTPIVAVTAHALQSHHERTLDAGMIGRITKPLQLDSLARTIELYAQHDRAEKMSEGFI